MKFIISISLRRVYQIVAGSPFEYLKDIFIKLPKLIAEAEKKDLTRETLKNLLPYHWKSTAINA